MRNWLGVEHQQKTSGQKKGLLLLGGGIFFSGLGPVTKGQSSKKTLKLLEAISLKLLEVH